MLSIKKTTKKITSISLKRTFKSDARIDLRFKLHKNIFKNIKDFGGIRQHTGKYLETYYDSNEASFPNQPDKWYFLAKQGKWLCTRENQWYLKQYKHTGPRSFKRTYDNAPREIAQQAVYNETAKEAFGEREVRWDLNLQQDFTNPKKKTLQEDLANIGIIPYAKFHNEVTRFALNNDFNLTIERYDFGYALGKLSVTIREPTPKKYENVAKEIMRVVFKLNLDVMAGHQEGIVSFLGRQRPIHYNDLRKLGAIEIPTLEERLEYGKRIRAMQKVKHIKYFKTEIEENVDELPVDDILDMSDQELKEKLGDEVYEAIRNEVSEDWKRKEENSLEARVNDILQNVGEYPFDVIEDEIRNLNSGEPKSDDYPDKDFLPYEDLKEEKDLLLKGKGRFTDMGRVGTKAAYEGPTKEEKKQLKLEKKLYDKKYEEEKK